MTFAMEIRLGTKPVLRNHLKTCVELDVAGKKKNMYRILDGSEKGIVAIKVEGKLNREEYELLNAYVDQRMQEGQVLNFLCDLVEVDGLQSQVVWEEMTRHLRNLWNSHRIAVVGDRGWLERGTIVFEPWLKTQLKHFTPDQIDEAWHWVKG